MKIFFFDLTQKRIAFLQYSVWLGIFSIIFLIGIRIINPHFLSAYSVFYSLPGKIASLLFLFLFIPGIIQRSGYNFYCVRILVALRRFFGLLMYFFGLVHLLFLVDVLPLFSDDVVTSFNVVTGSGFFALLVLLPVLFTSNNISVRFLKGRWKMVQHFSYLALPLIAMHVWEAGQEEIAILYIIITLLIIISYSIFFWRRNRTSFAFISTLIFLSVFTTTIIFAVLVYFLKDSTDRAYEELGKEKQTRIEELEREQIRINTILKETELLLKQEKIQRDAEQKKEKLEELVVQKENQAISDVQKYDYINGTYTDRVNYSTDNGKETEALTVQLVLEEDVVTSVSVTPHVGKSKSVKYFGRFSKEINSVVIGKDIDSLNAHAIGGASDTSTGFRNAVAHIKMKARNSEKL